MTARRVLRVGAHRVHVGALIEPDRRAKIQHVVDHAVEAVTSRPTSTSACLISRV